VLGYKVMEDNKPFFDGYMLIGTAQDKSEISKLYDDYKTNKLMARAKTLKREVLEFYLSS
jgi:hypothetical protein